jgi:RNA ligase
MIAEGYISKRKHPTRELYILNYTSKCQIDRMWNEATVMCRGLIVDDKWTIVARPFKKFFTLEQLSAFGLRSKCYHLYDKMKFSEIWNYEYHTFEKVDGSLGIVYWNPWDLKWEVASRGSFQSEQAVKANELLQKMPVYALECGHTYMVEIIYPENRIVVNYGDKEELILLGVVKNSTGQDDWYEFDSIKAHGWPTCEYYPELRYLCQFEKIEQNKKDEGFVLAAPNGFRLKFKFDEYLRLHEIMTNVTARNIWEKLRNGESLDEWMQDVPDEFYQWINSKRAELQHRFYQIELHARKKLQELQRKYTSRHQIAQATEGYKYRKIVFLMLDDKDYADVIWRMIKPEAEKPYAFTDDSV